MTAQQFLATLPAWDGQHRLADWLKANLDKEALLAAEVRLPVPPGFTGRLAAVSVRRPYRARIELIAVDVSRLPAS
jgi:hypothetical protein